MSEQIKRFFEVFIPNTTCNLKCHYCYLAQQGVSTKQRPLFKYSREEMKAAISPEILGGSCLFNLCADGETMVEQRTMQFAFDALSEGHYVNIATNATLTNRFKEVCAWPEEFRKRLLFIVGFHPIELRRLNLLDTVFNNIKMIKDAGCSYFLSLVFCAEYMEIIEEIKKMCLDNLGVLPQLAKVRNDVSSDVHIDIDMNPKEYFEYGYNEFKSPIFKLEGEFYQRKISEFCYAGDWFLYLNLCTGYFQSCYQQPVIGNLFENKKPLKLYAIGNHCRLPYCYNCPSRFSFGVLPEIKLDKNYWEYRNRTDCNGCDSITDEYKRMAQYRLYENNKEYGWLKKIYANQLYEINSGTHNLLYYMRALNCRRLILKIKRRLESLG